MVGHVTPSQQFLSIPGVIIDSGKVTVRLSKKQFSSRLIELFVQPLWGAENHNAHARLDSAPEDRPAVDSDFRRLCHSGFSPFQCPAEAAFEGRLRKRGMLIMPCGNLPVIYEDGDGARQWARR